MSPLVFHLPGDEVFADSFVDAVRADLGALSLHRFPDGESLVRLDADVAGREVVLVASLARPDDITLPLLFAADAARDLGASRVLLAAPYLAYLRQDRRFHAGEAITSRTYAALLSNAFDGLATVDPHLHRYHSLDEIYRMPTRVVHAASPIADWIRANVERPLLIGPDDESEQWVSEVAEGCGAPFTVLQKTRRGDRDVEVSLPDVSGWSDRQPVLVDDIVSSARTMIQAVGSVRRVGLAPPLCIGVHALFAPGAYAELRAAGPKAVITCDTVPHASNGISVVAPLARAIEDLLGR
ncbi:ribose-phosphate pyrophosphokinase [Roseateles puraquae]|jgi:ribose-phosphate pyrophosphokinase|uniref:Phosphoribosylpyrophosphate synthetase n=1 Tax=Roseateles puraquae TaxID=431059 RepID=A0A254MY87_9BURK|nr:ribose-phosphate pyrophosphokinase [Roseateles puraquae]MDG0855843.1 ribose-phosphate pyrophosphokinase [Roseateles puraquae]OWQ99918.1 phosphoribosylpyrophosphate synthetase [Roseateles puraquae]